MTDVDTFHSLTNASGLPDLFLQRNRVNVASAHLEDNLRLPLLGFLTVVPLASNLFMES